MVRVITYDTSIYKNIFDVMIDLAPTRTCFCIPNKFLVYSLTENTISKFLTNGNNSNNNNNNIYNMLDKLIDNSRRILLENNFNIDTHTNIILNSNNIMYTVKLKIILIGITMIRGQYYIMYVH